MVDILCYEPNAVTLPTASITEYNTYGVGCDNYAGMKSITSVNTVGYCVRMSNSLIVSPVDAATMQIESGNQKPQISGLDSSNWDSWSICPSDNGIHVATALTVNLFPYQFTDIICAPVVPVNLNSFVVNEDSTTGYYCPSWNQQLAVAFRMRDSSLISVKNIVCTSMNGNLALDAASISSKDNSACDANAVVTAVKTSSLKITHQCMTVTSHAIDTGNCETVSSNTGTMPNPVDGHDTSSWQYYASCMHLGTDYAMVELSLTGFISKPLDSIKCCRII